MIDIQLVRDDVDAYKKICERKRVKLDVEKMIQLDDARKEWQHAIDTLKAEQKQAWKDRNIDLAKELKIQIQDLEKKYTDTVEELDRLLLSAPNPRLHTDVPAWKDDSDNVQLWTRWHKPDFGFTPRDHVELMHMHDMLDIERGVKLAWSRSYILKNDAVLLEQAVLHYAFQSLVKKWFTALSVPYIVNEECFRGTWYFPWWEDDAYHTQDRQWLIATGEIPLTSYHSGEVLSYDELPKTYVTQTPSFRREAGTYGKDTHGLYRVHQFNKVEQVVILPEDIALSNERHDTILENALEVVRDLNLPHRLLQLCSGDLSIGKYNSHDVECRMPSRNGYGETHSATSFLDFQARRMNLRYRDEDGHMRYCYTLNNTVVATPRFLIALIENNQNEDGSIMIPEVLRAYMGKDKIG